MAAARPDAVLAALPQPVWSFDAEQRLAYANPAALAATGADPVASPEALSQLGLLHRLAGRGLLGPGEPAELASALLGEDPVAPFRQLLPQTAGGRLELHRAPQPGGGVVLTLVTQTAGCAGESATRAAQLEAVLSHLQGAIALYDPEQRLVLHNPAYEDLLGLPRGTVWPGLSQDELLRILARRGDFSNTDAEALIDQRRKLDRSRRFAYQRIRPNGQVLRFEGQPMPAGGQLLEVTDISALKRAEDEARERAALIHGVLAALPHGVAVFGPDDRVTLVNAAYQAIMAGAEISLGDHREAIARRRAASGEYGPGEPAELIARNLNAPPHRLAPRQRTRPNGTVLSIRYAQLPDGSMVQVSTDITALHAARAEATARAAALQAMLDHMRHGIAVYGPDHRLVAFNDLAATLGGAPRETLRVGVSLDAVVAALERRGALGTGEAAADEAARLRGLDRSFPFRSQGQTPDGRVVEITSDPTPDGGFVVTWVDVTARAAAEAAADQRAATLQVALEAMHHGIILYDHDRRLVAANSLAAAYCCLTPAVLVRGMTMADLAWQQFEAGGFGADPEARTRTDADIARDRSQPHVGQRTLPDGRVIEVRSAPAPDGGCVITFTDITPLARAEAAARQRAAALQGMLDNMRHGIVLYGPDRRVVVANDLGNALPGMAPGATHPGALLDDLIAERVRRDLAVGIDTVPPSQTLDRSHPQRWTRTTPAGRVLDITSDPLPDGGFVVCYVDQTELTEAKAEAQRRTEMLRTMQDAIRHGIALFDAEGRLMVANRLAATLAGLTPGALAPGMTTGDMGRLQLAAGVFGEGAAAAAELQRTIHHDRRQTRPVRRRMPDGRIVDSVSDPTPDGGFVVTWTDVTAQVAAEAAAAERAASLRDIIDNVRHGISLFGPDHRLITTNRLSATLSGLPQSSLTPGRPQAEIVADQLAAGATGDSALDAEYATQAVQFDRSLPLRYTRPALGGRTIEVTSDPMPDGGFVVTFTDITALAEAEAAATAQARTQAVMLDVIRHGVMLFGPDRRLIAANRLAATHSGAPEYLLQPGMLHEAVARGQHTLGVFGPEPQGSETLARTLAMDRGTAIRYQRTTPEGRLIEVVSDPTADGGFAITYSDITAQAAAEAEAASRADMLQKALDGMRHGLMLMDPDRRLVIANRLASPGYGVPDLRGRIGALFDDLVREQAATGMFGAEPEASALADWILGLDRSTSFRYRRTLTDGRVLEVGSEPLPDGGFVVTHSDITELARTEAEAQAQTATLRLTLDSMRHGLAQYDRDMRLVTANALAAEFNGLPRDALRPGMMAVEIGALAAQSGVITEASIAEALAEDYSKPTRRLRHRADGGVIEILTDPMVDGGFVATYSDITALTTAEAVARERAGTLQVMLDNMRHGICYYAPDRRLIAANALVIELAGYPADTLKPGVSLDFLIGQQLALGSVGGDATAIAAMARELDRRLPHRYVRPRHDGRLIEVTSDPTPDGGFVVTMSDVTALATAEAEAQRRATILQLMLDNIRHGIVLFDGAGRVMAANTVLRGMLDLPEAVITPGTSYDALIDFLHARGEYGAGEAGAAAASATKRRDRGLPALTERVRPNGAVLDIVSEPLPGGGWVLVFTDVTAERAIRAELEAAREAAETANRAKSRFLATMTHELRTPLNAVIGFSEALTADPDPQRGRDYVRSILESGRHLLSLIDDILDVARAETTGFSVTESEVDILPIAELSVRVMRATAATAGVTVGARLPPLLPLIRADELRLRQVLLNLLSNAVKFTPEGGTVTLAAEVDATGDLLIRVTDTGIGVRPEEIPRLFEPFTQLDNSLSRRFRGSGLGLYLSRALAEAQGATLTLESAVDVGTTAVLRFPKSRVVSAMAA